MRARQTGTLLLAAWLLALGLWASPTLVLAATGDECGGVGQVACPVTARVPSCDYNLVEAADHRCVRPACGAERQRPCGVTERVILDPVLKTLVPQPCDINLKAVGNVCVHPNCGREGQAPCPVWERVPSCDLDLVERPFQACERPACGRLGEAPCNLVQSAMRQGRSCDINLMARGGSCQRPVMPPSVAESVGQVAQGVKKGVVGAAQGVKKAATVVAQGTAKAVKQVGKTVAGAAQGVKQAAAGEVHAASPVTEPPAPAEQPAQAGQPTPPPPRAGLPVLKGLDQPRQRVEQKTAAQAPPAALNKALHAAPGADRTAPAREREPLPTLTATLQMSTPIYRTDQLVVVHYAGMPGTKHDWITIVPADAPPDAYGEWAWLGQESGSHRFGRLLKPGRYQVRAFENWPAGQFALKGKVDFIVR